MFSGLEGTADLAHPLQGIAIIAAESGDATVALTLAGAIAAKRARRASLPSLVEERYRTVLAGLEHALTQEDRTVALAAGREMSTSEAIELAMRAATELLSAARSLPAGES